VPAVSAAALVAAGGALALSTLGLRGTEDAVAAVRKAARVSAASAERSGTAVVRMTHDGPWTYSVACHGLGSTAAPAAPGNAQSLEKLRRARAERALRGATSER
jgi:hypothetical protein